ncbi:MAG: hypothetical protein ACLRVT_09975 [Oscillospiraceae bacterium]
MIKLIIGNKGSGKTKKLIDLVNTASKTTKGNVVCIEKGTQLTYDIVHSVRLIDIDTYQVSGFEAFYGFICGVLAGNYDISEMFIDATFKIGGRDYAAFAEMIRKLDSVVDKETVVTFTVSCDISDLPEDMKSYSI